MPDLNQAVPQKDAVVSHVAAVTWPLQLGYSLNDGDGGKAAAKPQEHPDSAVFAFDQVCGCDLPRPLQKQLTHLRASVTG